MKKFLIAAAGLVALAAPAFAADMAPAPVYTKAPPPVVAPPCIWCGGYVGINGGGGWENNTWTFPIDTFFDHVPGQGFGTHPSGAVAGGQIGYNWQLAGPWVMGVELMGDWANLKQTLIGALTPSFPNDVYTTQLRDLESLTLRFGYGPTNWLFYGKAGVATGTERLSVVSGPPIPGFGFSDSTRQWGPTAGVGVEYLMTPNFVIGAEYDYASLSKVSNNVTATCDGNPGCITHVPDPFPLYSSRFNVNTAVVRLSYKWGGPVVARY
jgi:outer membrane immunogenic protein